MINLQESNYVLLTTAFISVMQLAITFGIESMSLLGLIIFRVSNILLTIQFLHWYMFGASWDLDDLAFHIFLSANTIYYIFQEDTYMLSGCELIDTENISLPSQNITFVGE